MNGYANEVITLFRGNTAGQRGIRIKMCEKRAE